MYKVQCRIYTVLYNLQGARPLLLFAATTPVSTCTSRPGDFLLLMVGCMDKCMILIRNKVKIKKYF